MSETNQFHWAGKVSRREIQRLYESDARGLLDEELLDRVLYTIHARICDMFEVRQAQQHGQVKCRNCGALLHQPYRMGGANKNNPMQCVQCGWGTTCGEYYASYTGKDLLPGSRKDLFEDFLERFPAARTPQEKLLLLDWLIHEFHAHSGLTGRLVAQNVIQGSRQQLIELLTTLATGEASKAVKEAWLAEEDNPLRRFRKQYPSHARLLRLAAQLGIPGRTRLPENELIAEILRQKPELGGQ